MSEDGYVYLSRDQVPEGWHGKLFNAGNKVRIWRGSEGYGPDVIEYCDPYFWGTSLKKCLAEWKRRYG